MLGLVGLTLLAVPPASGASFDCTSQWLNRTERTICGDPQLARMDEQVGRRIRGLRRRLNFGQYLGLRHWHATQAKQHSLCAVDRNCIAARFRTQGRFLDRLQRCIATNLARRACLRGMLASERESVRR